MNPQPSMPPPSEPPAAPRRYAVVMLWLLVLVVLVAGFSWLEARRDNPNQSYDSGFDGGVAEVTLKQDRLGHYGVAGEINGYTVPFVVDTGASSIAIPESMAQSMGLRRGPAVTVITANGEATGYLTRLDEVRLGPIVQRDISATIQPGLENEILLGMNFLRELEMVQRDRTLILRQY